jgi:hypothetical protein
LESRKLNLISHQQTGGLAAAVLNAPEEKAHIINAAVFLPLKVCVKHIPSGKMQRAKGQV